MLSADFKSADSRLHLQTTSHAMLFICFGTKPCAKDESCEEVLLLWVCLLGANPKRGEDTWHGDCACGAKSDLNPPGAVSCSHCTHLTPPQLSVPHTTVSGARATAVRPMGKERP